MTTKLAYLGPVGTFTEEAAECHDSGAERIPFPTILSVINSVGQGDSDEGIVPIENSLEGSVNDTLDLLIHESSLSIRKEIVLPINHCLLVNPGTDISSITAIYSHPQALGQCRRFLEENFSGIQTMASLSTAAAVAQMKDSIEPVGAIAPGRTAKIYSVDILLSGVQDESNNVTRFVVLGDVDHPPTGADKTSLCFSFEGDGPGLLYGAMKIFAERDINLVKIESRPTKSELGRYVFLIDLEGHREDRFIGEALRELAAHVSDLKLFGSYPRHQ